MERFGYLCHGYDGSGGEAVALRYLLKRANVAAFSNFHAIKRDHKSRDLDVCNGCNQRIRFFDRLAGSGYVFHHDDLLAVVKLGA